MSRIGTRYLICGRPPAIDFFSVRRLSTSIPRYGSEGISPKLKALEAYQVPKSNIPGRTLLTHAGRDDIREKPRWQVWLGMKLFRNSVMRKATVSSKARTVMQEYYALCATRATADGDETSVGFWYDELGLQPSFTTWFQVTALHVYMLHTRLRCYKEQQARVYQQALMDTFFEDIEMRIYFEFDIKSQRFIQNLMKELHQDFTGLTIGYDEGLVKNDAVLAAAFWRNLFQHSPSTVDFEKLAKIVNYFWKNVKLLDLSGQEAFSAGEFGFLSPDRTPPGMEWQPHYEDLAEMIKNINLREKQWALDRRVEMEELGWDFSKPLKLTKSELPTIADEQWDKERQLLGYADFPAIPPPQDADQVLAEDLRMASEEKGQINASEAR